MNFSFFILQANVDAYDTVHVVIGNESCDLDSVISAISYAFYLNKVSVM
jgi:hypothetical protein